MIDYHNHLEKGELTPRYLRQFAEAARKRGITEMGISEHAYMFSEFRPVYESELARCEDNLREKQRDWLESKGFVWTLEDYFQLLRGSDLGGIDLRVGLEVDYFPGAEELTASVLSDWLFDYLIGSVHWVDGWIYDVWPESWRGRDVRRTWQRYFSTARKMVDSGLFDVMGHPDSIKVFGHRPQSRVSEDIARLVDALSETGMAAEVNTAFCYRGYSEDFCPGPEILSQMSENGVQITFGSDAHRPCEAGLLLDEAVQVAREFGYERGLRFRRRQKVKFNLPG